MTTLWKLEAVHESFDGSFCRLFRTEDAAAEAAVSLTLNGWWLDVERLVWPPLNTLKMEIALTNVWPIADPEKLLDLIWGPPILERELALDVLRFETEEADELARRRRTPREQAAQDLAAVVTRKNQNRKAGQPA